MSTGLMNDRLLGSKSVVENAITARITVTGYSEILVSVQQYNAEIARMRFDDGHGRRNLADLVSYIQDKDYQHVDDLRFVLDYDIGLDKEFMYLTCLHVYGAPNIIAGIAKILATLTI